MENEKNEYLVADPSKMMISLSNEINEYLKKCSKKKSKGISKRN
jgi:hypothetical protein